jgi:hypothetical protein
MSTTLREQIDTYVKRVKDLSEHVRGNEQATKQSLIGPFFTMLGYDLTDPRECIPEYRADFGKERSSKPIDWAFLNGTTFAFFVEAKEVGKKLTGFDEQLADYFAKETSVKLGILTNGAQWRFFTDIVHPNVMDKEPFAAWDIAADEVAPFDVITLLQKSQFNSELIRAYAQRKRAQNLLVGELSRLLEPAPEFTKLAIANLETRNLTQAVTESWKPVVAAALNEWARQRMLASVLAAPAPPQDTREKAEPKIETTAEELAAFEIIRGILGPENPIAYEDSVAYFKIHLAERRTWVFARLQFGKKQTSVWVPLPIERATPLASGKAVAVQSGWSVVNLEPNSRIDELAELFKAAYQHVKRSRSGEPAEE